MRAELGIDVIPSPGVAYAEIGPGLVVEFRRLCARALSNPDFPAGNVPGLAVNGRADFRQQLGYLQS